MHKLFWLLCFVALSAVATETSPESEISTIITYSEYGGGDLIFILKSNGSVCKNGYFIKTTDPGFDANLTILLSAYHTNTPVSVSAHDDRKWDGSTGYYCHVYAIRM